LGKFWNQPKVVTGCTSCDQPPTKHILLWLNAYKNNKWIKLWGSLPDFSRSTDRLFMHWFSALFEHLHVKKSKAYKHNTGTCVIKYLLYDQCAVSRLMMHADPDLVRCIAEPVLFSLPKPQLFNCFILTGKTPIIAKLYRRISNNDNPIKLFGCRSVSNQKNSEFTKSRNFSTWKWVFRIHDILV
jgi:hypothetical protein